jgi:hypothetical protein
MRMLRCPSSESPINAHADASSILSCLTPFTLPLRIHRPLRPSIPQALPSSLFRSNLSLHMSLTLHPGDMLSHFHPPHTFSALHRQSASHNVPPFVPVLVPSTLPTPQTRPYIPACLAVPPSWWTRLHRMLILRYWTEAQVGISSHRRTRASSHAEGYDAHWADVGLAGKKYAVPGEIGGFVMLIDGA